MKKKDTRKEEETKKKIIEGAKRLFQLYGFQRLTVDEIAVNLKMSKKTIYQHFESKDAIIWAVINSILTQATGEIEKVRSGSTNMAEALTNLTTTVQRTASQITPPMIQDMQRLPHIWEKVDEKRKALIAGNEQLLKRGQEMGFVRSDLDVKFLIAFLIRLVSSIATPQTLIELNMTLPDMIKTLISLFSFGIMTEEGKKHFGVNNEKFGKM